MTRPVILPGAGPTCLHGDVELRQPKLRLCHVFVAPVESKMLCSAPLKTSFFTLCKAIDLHSLCVFAFSLDFFLTLCSLFFLLLSFPPFGFHFLKRSTMNLNVWYKGLPSETCEKLIKSCLVQMHYVSTLRANSASFQMVY